MGCSIFDSRFLRLTLRRFQSFVSVENLRRIRHCDRIFRHYHRHCIELPCVYCFAYGKCIARLCIYARVFQKISTSRKSCRYLAVARRSRSCSKAARADEFPDRHHSDNFETFDSQSKVRIETQNRNNISRNELQISFGSYFCPEHFAL